MPLIRMYNSSRFLPPPWVMTLLAAAFAIWLVTELREIVILLVVGYFIAYVMHPALSRFEKWGIGRGVGVIVILGLLLIAGLVLVLTAIPTIAKEYEKLSDNFPQYVDTARSRVRPWIEKVKDHLPGYSAEQGMDLTQIPGLNGENFGKVLKGVVGALLQGYSLTLALVNLFLLPFIVFYIAVDFRAIHRGALELFPLLQRRKVAAVALEIDRYVAAFVRGQILVCSVLFVLYAVGLSVIGVELWLLLSIVAGFGNMIPYLGFLVGIILSSIMALVTFGDFQHLLQTWAVFAVIQFLEGIFITPRIMGKNVGMSPLMVILAIFTGGKLFGLLGIFLAVPGAAVVKVLLRHLHERVVGISLQPEKA